MKSSMSADTLGNASVHDPGERLRRFPSCDLRMRVSGERLYRRVKLLCKCSSRIWANRSLSSGLIETLVAPKRGGRTLVTRISHLSRRPASSSIERWRASPFFTNRRLSTLIPVSLTSTTRQGAEKFPRHNWPDLPSSTRDDFRLKPT